MKNFPLRLPDHVMDEARAAAQQDSVSINQMLTALIADGIGHRRGLQTIRERASRGDPAGALSILDRVPDVAPDHGDEREALSPSVKRS